MVKIDDPYKNTGQKPSQKWRKANGPLRIFIGGRPYAGKTTMVEVLQEKGEKISVSEIDRRKSSGVHIWKVDVELKERGKEEVKAEFYWSCGPVFYKKDLLKKAFRWCHGLLFVVDLQSGVANDNLMEWFELATYYLEEHLCQGYFETFPTVLCYNKIDLAGYSPCGSYPEERLKPLPQFQAYEFADGQCDKCEPTELQQKQVAFFDRGLNFYDHPRYITLATGGINCEKAFVDIIRRAKEYKSTISH